MVYEAVIEFTEAFTGKDLDVKVPREETCEACDGTGSKSRHRATCRQCGGQGQVFQSRSFFRMATTCPVCHGAGTVVEDPCDECHGAGRVKRSRTINVKIPAGVDTGTRLRLNGEGESGYNGGPAGDFYVEIVVRHHEFFGREGRDVLLERKIDMASAALGCEIDVPTVTGETVPLAVPAGSQAGRMLRLPGLGFKSPIPHNNVVGDIVVTLLVETPTDLTERQAELLREFAELEAAKRGESPLKRMAKKAGRKLKKALNQ